MSLATVPSARRRYCFVPNGSVSVRLAQNEALPVAGAPDRITPEGTFMSERRMGPPRHTEDPYTRLLSPRGIPVDQLVSVLQKDIRRGNVDNAVLAAYEMLMTSPEVAEHMWHRLKVIAVEDIGMGGPLAPVVLNSLHENYRAATGGEQTVMAIHAVRFLATAKKDRRQPEPLTGNRPRHGGLVDDRNHHRNHAPRHGDLAARPASAGRRFSPRSRRGHVRRSGGAPTPR